MPIVYRAILTSPEPLSKESARLWNRWIDEKARSRNLRIPDAIGDRLNFSHEGWRTTFLAERGEVFGSTGRRYFLYEPPTDDGTTWITSMRVTDLESPNEYGTRGVVECVLTIRGNTDIPGVAAPRVIREIANAVPVSIDPIGLGYELLEAGTADEGQVRRRWRSIEKWMKVPTRGVEVERLIDIVDDPRRSVPVVLITNASKDYELFEDARQRAARIARAIAGSACVAFVAGPEGRRVADALGPVLGIQPWSGAIRIIPAGVTTETAQRGDAPLISWRQLLFGRDPDFEARVIGQLVLPRVAERTPPEWIRDLWDDLEPERLRIPQAAAPSAAVDVEPAETVGDDSAMDQLVADLRAIADEDGIAIGDLPLWIGMLRSDHKRMGEDLEATELARAEAELDALQSRATADEALAMSQSMQQSMVALAALRHFAPTDADPVAATCDADTCCEVLEWAAANLPFVRISDHAHARAEGLDKKFPTQRVKVWAGTTLNGLLMLNAYAEACELNGGSVGPLHGWAVSDDRLFGLGPERIASTETKVTKDQFGHLRDFPTLNAAGVAWSDTSRMLAHLKIGHDKTDAPHSPRLHFEYRDDLKVVVVGYLGEHLQSASTARL